MKELQDYHIYFSLWHVKSKKKQKDDGRGFAFIRFKDLMLTNYKCYSLPLYSNHKKLSDGYLDGNNKYLKSEGDDKCIKFVIRLGNMERYFDLVVTGYLKDVEKEFKFSIPDELCKLVVMMIM